MNGLRLNDVSVRFGATAAVDGVSLEVAPGEIVALLGPSGCGKSSLLRAVAGLEPLTEGSVGWGGADMAGVPVHRRGFGLLFQDGQLFVHRDVAGNVGYGVPRGQDRPARVAELLDLVGLPGAGPRRVDELSGGERQRVALARSLAARPAVLLLDEPLSALDRELRERLAVDLRRVLLATGTTAVFVTHDHDEAFTVADRVAVMSGGRLLQVGTPAALWAAPVSVEVARFLGYEAFVSCTPDDAQEHAAESPAGVRPAHQTVEGLGDLCGPDLHGEGVLAIAPGAFRIDERPGGLRGTVVSTRLRRGQVEALVEVPGVGVLTVWGHEEPGSDEVALVPSGRGVVRIGS